VDLDLFRSELLPALKLDVKPSFRVDAYVASIAYRALPWAGSVKVLEDGKRLIEMDRREEK